MIRAGATCSSGGRAAALVCAVVIATICRDAGAQDVITLRSSAIVEGSGPVTLKDIAELTGAQAEGLAQVTFEGAAAVVNPGSWREIGISDVRAALEARDDINWGRLLLRGASCSVRRADSPAPPKGEPTPAPIAAPDGPTVQGLIARRVAEALGVGADDLRLTFDENDRALLDTSVAGRTADIQMVGASERQPVSVRLFEGLAVVASGTARVTVSVRRTVAVSSVSFRRGETVRPESLTIEERWIAPGLRPAPSGSVAGTVVRTRIEAGEVIEGKDIEAPLVMKKGDLIDVYCVYGTVSIRAVARAMGNGRTGETVRLQSPESKRSFLARIDGPGRAVTGVPVGEDGIAAMDGGGDGSSDKAAGGRTEAPVPAGTPSGGERVAEVGGFRVMRSARPEELKRAEAAHRRLSDLADRPLKKKESRP